MRAGIKFGEAARPVVLDVFAGKVIPAVRGALLAEAGLYAAITPVHGLAPSRPVSA